LSERERSLFDRYALGERENEKKNGGEIKKECKFSTYFFFDAATAAHASLLLLGGKNTAVSERSRSSERFLRRRS
jgi:hypothetical protein